MAIKRQKGEEKLYRQYPLKNNMTQSKKQTILTLLQKYRKISSIIQSDIIKEYQKTGYINKYIAYKDLSSYDSIYEILPKTAYIQMSLTQVIEMLLSRESNIQNTITVFIEKLESKQYTSDIKHMLHILNNQSRTRLANSRMVFGYTHGIQEHLDIINTHRIKNSLHKSMVCYQKEIKQVSEHYKDGLITAEQKNQETEVIKERYQVIQRYDIKKIELVSYNNKNKVINKDKKEITIPDSVYTMYKQIYKHVTKKWKYPSCKNIAMRIDSRCVTLENPVSAFQSGKLLYWLRLKLISSVEQDNGKKKFDIHVPLLKNEYFVSKKGSLANAVFIGLSQDGELFIRIMKNMTDSIKKSKADYQTLVQKKYGNTSVSTETISNDNGRILALDFGLRVMFSDQHGNQYGRDWFSTVRQYDSMVQNRIRHLKEREQNPKLSEDAVYIELIRKTRNYIKNEVNRVLTHIVKTRNPDKLILENIRFVNPELSKSMNRLIQNCGRMAISSKLKSLEEEYGVVTEYVNPAYTSQICSSCGMVHSESRKGDRYECIECGNKLNADVNAARNILMRYLINNTSVSNVNTQDMEPCSISLYMSKHSVRNTVTDFSFLKMFHLMKEQFLKSITAQEPMTKYCLKTG